VTSSPTGGRFTLSKIQFVFYNHLQGDGDPSHQAIKTDKKRTTLPNTIKSKDGEVPGKAPNHNASSVRTEDTAM